MATFFCPQGGRFREVQLYFLGWLTTCGLSLSHTSTVKMVALLLNAEERDDMTAAIITANISPTIPVGRMFNTNLPGKNHVSV